MGLLMSAGSSTHGRGHGDKVRARAWDLACRARTAGGVLRDPRASVDNSWIPASSGSVWSTWGMTSFLLS